ncbi:MAG: sialidase family protein [Actinomycetota bacterium]
MAVEPTLGFTDDGSIFAQAVQRRTVFQPEVIRSTDGGATWDAVTPAVGDQNRTRLTMDPYLYVDPATARVFTANLTAAPVCSDLSFSDDGGESWTTSAVCGQFDHQTVFAGPAVTSPTIGYPNIVYFCAVNGGLATPTSTYTTCARSLDGGLTFSPTGEPAYVTDVLRPNGHLGPAGLCDGASGHGIVDGDGTVYLPRGWCGQPYLAISRNEGTTWTRVQVARTGMSDQGGVFDHEAGVAVDGDGNLYYTWVGRNRLPYLAVSRDGGSTWSKPLMIGAPEVELASFPGIAVGKAGRLAMVYMGSADGRRWNGYMTMTADALARSPILYSASVNARRDPLIKGDCGPTFQCGAVYDFVDVVIGPDGTPWGSFVDGCTRAGCTTDSGSTGPFDGVMGRLVGGPRLS